jgi:dTDP-4-amino-4,6-dideoxygalactose transaminase
VADWYAHYLARIEEVTPPQLVENTTRVSWFVYVIRVAKQVNRDRFAHILKERGIPVRPYFSPIHLQPFVMEMFGTQLGDYPVTEDLGNRSLALPFSGTMTEEEVVTVCQQIAEAVVAAEKTE